MKIIQERRLRLYGHVKIMLENKTVKSIIPCHTDCTELREDLEGVVLMVGEEVWTNLDCHTRTVKSGNKEFPLGSEHYYYYFYKN